MGIEVHFPEVFAEYERLDVDGVLLSTGPGQTPGGTAAFATQTRAHAATNSLWVSFAMAAQHSVAAPAGTVAPDPHGQVDVLDSGEYVRASTCNDALAGLAGQRA